MSRKELIEQMAQAHPCHFEPAFDCLMKVVFIVAALVQSDGDR